MLHGTCATLEPFTELTNQQTLW